MKTKVATKANQDYMTLIARFHLRPIHSDKEMDAANDILEELSDKIVSGEKLSEGQRNYMETLIILIGEWEKESPRMKEFREGLPKRTTQELLQSFMQDHGMSQSALARQIDCPQSVISEFLAGRRGLSKVAIVKLADYFKVSTDLFMTTLANKPRR